MEKGSRITHTFTTSQPAARRGAAGRTHANRDDDLSDLTLPSSAQPGPARPQTFLRSPSPSPSSSASSSSRFQKASREEKEEEEGKLHKLEENGKRGEQEQTD